MTLTYNVSNNYTFLSLSLLERFLPAPMGVGINVVTTQIGSGRSLSTSTYGRILSYSNVGRITSVGS